MGIFDRFRARPEEWHPPTLGACGCEDHVEQMVDVEIPRGAQGGDGPPVRVGDLVARQELRVRLSLPEEVYATRALTGERTGPFQWRVEYGDALGALYDEDAPAHLDDSVAIQPGIERLDWPDHVCFTVGAPTLCPSGVLAAVVKGLQNPRVRRP